MMHKLMALLRVSWLTALSFRANLALSVVGIAAVAIPVFFIAGALQPMMSDTIRGFGSQYFAFVLVGMAAFTFVAPAMSAAPGTLSQGIASGSLEAMLATPTALPTLVVGTSAYGILWNFVRFVTLLVVGGALGASLAWGMFLPIVAIVLLLIATYFSLGLVDAACYVAWRVRIPITQSIVLLSGLLGGVYYPTRVIPGWLRPVAEFIPLTHALRAMRRLLLAGEPLSSVGLDVAKLAVICVTSLAFGSLILSLGLRAARSAGRLAQA